MQCLVLAGMLLAIAGCQAVIDAATPTASPTRDLPTPEVYTTETPDVEPVVQAFLDNWKQDDYASMYAMLSTASQTAIAEEQFVQRYQEMANEATLSDIEYEILSSTRSPQHAEVGFRIVYRSAIVGELVREMLVRLVFERGDWFVEWNEGLIMPELAGGNYLRMDRNTPTRSTIYDRNANPLAAQAEAVAIGVWPGYVDLADEKTNKGLIALLSGLTGYRSDTIRGMIENADPGAYLPLGEIPVDQDPHRLDLLTGWNAAVTSRYSSRLYYGSGVGPHVVGYVSAIQEEEIDEYRRLGYRSDERVGRKGVELWGESTLIGKRGGTLYVFNPEGKPIQQLGSAASEAGKDIYMTIDREFQQGVQKAMSAFSGAIVVVERDSGRVLAMASAPGFDQNAFQIENYNWNALLTEIINNPNSPQFNRASQGQYPLGSVFKLVTIAAALQSGRYTAESVYDCGYVFEELPGFPRYDWTYEHFQEDGVTQPSGRLTLPQGLIRSCNPYFWHIGLDLYNVGLTTTIADMSRSFGLGSLTGIEGVDEEPGSVPDPQSQVDAINLAIGQGDFLTTPLQVASFVAALGNGGTLYKPQLIERIAPPGGEPVIMFEPQVRGSLPISPENLKIIHDAMVGVVRSERPVGTAFRTFSGLDINVAGKTGTATAPVGDSHAWFAGYTFEGREDKADIAVAVIAENAGEGAEFAAPIFRRVIELWFYGKPLKVYRWEATFDVTRSPTPIVTFTPTLQPGLNP